MDLPLAHAAHWAFYVLYAVPVVIVLASIAASLIRQRGERRDPTEQPQR